MPSKTIYKDINSEIEREREVKKRIKKSGRSKWQQ